ncbi:MAG: hypothetical protein ABIQ18_09070, partial [Umezawaea sp.]
NVRHATDDTINRLAPDLATANTAVETNEAAVTTADDNLTAVRDTLPDLQTNVDTATQGVTDVTTEVNNQVKAQADAATRTDLAADAKTDADNAVNTNTTAVNDLTTEVGDAQTAVDDATATVADAQKALVTHQNTPRPAPVEGQQAQPDLVGPQLVKDLADAKSDLATEQGKLDELTTELTEAQGKLDQAVIDQGLADVEVNAAAAAVTKADIDHAKAVADLTTAQDTLDTENGRLQAAKDEAQRLQGLLDQANTDLDTAVDAQQDIAGQITQAEQALEQARNAADVQQQAWWNAKTAVDQQVDAFNTPAPPPADSSVAPPAPPTGGVPPIETATPSPSAAPAPAPRGPSPERSFDFAPGSTSLDEQQSATVDALANDLTESVGKRADRGFLPPKVEVSGANAPAVKAALDAKLNGSVDVAIAEGGRPNGADVNVDWDLKRPEGYVPPEAPKSVKVTDTVITADGPQAPHPILSDQSWRHSDAPSADWSRPNNPVSSQDIRAARDTAPVSTVRSEDGGLLSTSTVAPGKVDFKAWRGPIAYDKRSIDVNGVKVQDYTVKVFLNPSTSTTPAQVDAVKARTVEGVESLFNQGHRLPSNDQLHVTVEFTDNPADAHGHIAITDPNGRANQLNWPVDTDSRRLAHEVGHFLGLQDEYHETGAAKPIFQHQDGKGRVVADNGPMTAGIDSPTMEIKPRNLWLIETRADALASPNAAPLTPPASIDSSLAPPNAPSPDGVKVPQAQQDALNVQGGYAFDVKAADTRTSLVESIAVTLAPDSPNAQRALADKVNAATSSATIADVAAAADVRVHVLGTDGKFTSHGPITGVPVHVVENGKTGGDARYHATKENVHIGRSGVSYPGPTTIKHDGELKTVHRGEFEIETIAGRHQVRIYTAIVNPQTITPDADGKPTSQWKDIQQDPNSGDLTFSTGKGEGPLWAGAGRPQRALQWLTKYEHTDGGKPDLQNPAIIKRPVLRSFLVPLDTFNKITTETKIEGVPGATVNVDQRGEANQFGIGGDHLTELIKNAEPGSLTSYPANPTAGFAHEPLAGRITPLTEMNGKVGLSPDFRSDALGKAYDPWFNWKQEPDGSWKTTFRNDAHRLHEIATELREHDVTWQQVRQDPANRTDDARIEPDHESIPHPRPDAQAGGPKDLGYDARVQRLNQFLNEIGPASVNVRKITDDVLSTGPDALRTHLAVNGVPAVDQAAYQRALDQTVRDAVRDAAKTVDLAIKQVKGPVADQAALEALVRDGIPPKTGKITRDFTAEVAVKVANDFAAKVEAHPSLALLDAASRLQVANHLRDDMKTAVSEELRNLNGLEATPKGGKKGGWLSGPRSAEFGSRVAANMAARPAPTTPVAIDPSLLADVAENKVLAPVVTDALDAFTGQDLVTSSPDDLKSVVSTDVLPELSTNIRTALRTDPALALADQSFRNTMADSVANNAQARAGLALATFTFDPVNPAEVDALMAKVPEIATQAEIGALIAADSDRIAMDFNTRTEGADPFLNSYFQWNAERSQVFDDQLVAGDKLSESINVPEPDAHAVVDQLIKQFGELDRKFDEVATAPQTTPFRAPGATTPFTFYEHSQMVLGQYFKLTAAENADTRLIPVDALAKAILFHDIEKNNAKNQFGDGQGRHDREPEHKLAVEMMDRYRGLWDKPGEFAAARAIVDSDPFGFYLRNKITADEAFSFIHDLAGKIDDTNPDNPKKLFDEFHQYYQADFSSYTPDSTYVDRNGDTRNGPNAFTDRFHTGTDGIELTGDKRHFEYAGNHEAAQKMRDLAAMFADPATVAEHHARITGHEVTPPNAPTKAYPQPPNAPATEQVAVPKDADPEVVTTEARQAMADITEKYGIEVDSTASATAIKESHPGASQANLDKVTARKWDPKELKGLQDALTHYEPILGAARENSTRAGHAQELTNVGAVSRAIKGTTPFLLATGEYIASHNTFTIYPMAMIGNSFGGGAKEVEATATHELAHGLLKYALPEYSTKFGTWDADGKPVLAAGAERPYKNTKDAADDFKESIKSHLLGGSTFAETAPKHAAAIADLADRHPDVFERQGVELSEVRAKRIAKALSAELGDFSGKVGTWAPDGKPNFAAEPPITNYGATNPDEDLSEAAMVYFLDPDRLRAQAPQRFAFLDGLVAGWQPDGTVQPPNAPASSAGTPSPWTAPSSDAPVRRGPAPERSFDFAPGSTTLDAQQSASVTSLVDDLAEAVTKRADLGYLPPKVEVSGANAQAVKDVLTAELGGSVEIGIAEGGRPDGADVMVDWDLERPDGYVPPEAPKSVKVTDTVITADGPQAAHPILSDESWRHSDAASSDWSRPSNPVSSQDIRAARDTAPISTVRSEDGGVLTTSTITPDKVDLKAWRGPIAYDKRTFEVDGVRVQDYTVKVHLDASGPDVDALKARTLEGVDALFNQGHRLPSNDQLHVTVEFTDNPADAHGHIAITGPDGRANQLSWPVDTDSRRLAHEVGHFLGLQDEYVEPGRAKPVFQHQDGKGRVVADNGPMTAGIDSPTMEIKPRNLWLIETRSNALASPNLLPPNAFESDAAPPNAPAAVDAEALLAEARRAEAAARAANLRADREVDHRADALFATQDDERRAVLMAEFQTALEERATAVADTERRTQAVQEAADVLAEQQRVAGSPPPAVTDSTVPAASTPSTGRPTDVLDWAARMPLVDLAMNDPDARIRQGQSTREHVRRVLEVLGRPAPRSLPGLVRFLPKITEVTAQGPEAEMRNDAIALASVVDNVARDMSESFNDPLLKPVFARKIIESQADRLRWDGDATSSMSPETIRLAGALVSDDPLTSFMRGDVELPAVAARVEAIAQRAGLDPQTTFDLLRRRYEAEMLSYTMSEIHQGELDRDANANGNFDLANLPGEIAPGYYRHAVELRKTTSQRFFDTLKWDKPGEPEWNNKDLVLTKAASDHLDGLRAVLAPASVAESAWVPPTSAVPPTVGHPTTPARLPFTAADLTTGRNGLTPSAATTSVPLPGSDHAGSLTQRQYEHLRDIRTNRVDTAAARRASVKQDLVGKLGVPDLAAAEQVLAKAETWFATAPITISLKGGTVFGTDQGAAALGRPDAHYLTAAEIGLHVVDSSTLGMLRTKQADVDARRADVQR